MKNTILTLVLGFVFTGAAIAQPEKIDEAAIITLDSFSAKIARETMPQIIDARSQEEFALNHLNGAVNFNLQSEDYDAFVQALDKTKPVFVYSINTFRSGQLGADLIKKGFTSIYNLEGGIANWIGGGLPYYTTAKKPMSLKEYKSIIAANDEVLVDIGSLYCGACKRVKPVLDSLRQEYGSSLKILEINLEDSPQLIAELKTVNVFPYLILYKRGEIVLKKAGIKDLKPTLDAAIAKNK